MNHRGTENTELSQRTILNKIFSRENMLAVGLCVVVILLLIATTDSAPQWIYQGF